MVSQAGLHIQCKAGGARSEGDRHRQALARAAGAGVRLRNEKMTACRRAGCVGRGPFAPRARGREEKNKQKRSVRILALDNVAAMPSPRVVIYVSGGTQNMSVSATREAAEGEAGAGRGWARDPIRFQPGQTWTQTSLDRVLDGAGREGRKGGSAPPSLQRAPASLQRRQQNQNSSKLVRGK